MGLDRSTTIDGLFYTQTNGLIEDTTTKVITGVTITEENVPNKKRVVLGEILNLTDIVGLVNKIQGKKTIQKLKVKGKAKTKASMVKILLKEATQDDEGEKSVDVGVVFDDLQMCGYYAADIYEYLHQIERIPLPDYIEKVQKDVSTNMRAILGDWLVEVLEEYILFKILPSEFIAILLLNILFFVIVNVLLTALIVSNRKYEGINPPNVEDFCYITDNTCTKDQVTFPFFLLVYLYSFEFHSALLHSFTNFCWINVKVVKMETKILNSLKFKLYNPTLKTFFRYELVGKYICVDNEYLMATVKMRFISVAQEHYKVRQAHVSYAVVRNVNSIVIGHWFYGSFKYFIGFQLEARVPWVLPSGVEFVGLWMCKTSTIHGCCSFFFMFLTRFIIRPKRHPWSSSLKQCSGYKASDLKECVLIIHGLYLSRRGCALQAVREKYKQHKMCTFVLLGIYMFNFVATMSASLEISSSYFVDFQEVDI
ncbi:hypothetical protein GQ457_16G015120 [Hibiscus cannabinus]